MTPFEARETIFKLSNPIGHIGLYEAEQIMQYIFDRIPGAGEPNNEKADKYLRTMFEEFDEQKRSAIATEGESTVFTLNQDWFDEYHQAYKESL